ncbi:hypothetical protein Q0A17_04270 [Citrobacter sp. S2-9]|uniref:Secreted protein n=1 Tax=Citrobacter enshiensis TaxID=2971264 RepID=A0ABT8PRG5_9ENTR|nr:hypothetical protein [Citrobacter enshiensis]MDN8598638.1 hypothetical protein [Citrobacter enshiensis]
MNKIRIALICAALSCVALTGCTSDQLKETQKTERQVLSNKQQTDRQVERAEKSLAISSASMAAAAANLSSKKQQQKQADEDLQQLLCPQSEAAK